MPPNHSRPCPGPRAQRGAATLLAVTAIFLAMLLIALHGSRNLLVEQRSAAHQAASTQATEAAEAGLEWALALLNSTTPIADDCQPSDAATGLTLRERLLAAATVGAPLTPLTTGSGASPQSLRAACVATDSEWHCSCPRTTAIDTVALAADGSGAAFAVRLVAVPQSGRVRLLADGCARPASDCLDGNGDLSGATAQAEVTLGLLPGLRNAPASAVSQDGAADADADRAHALHFGLSRADWKRQPVVTPLACSGDCSATWAAMLVQRPAARLFSVSGDLLLSAPLTLGTPDRPVLIVADGAVELRGDVVVHGVIQGRSVRWNGAPTDAAQLHGALIAQTDYQSDGTPDLQRDAAVLSLLREHSGNFVRVHGSWRDF